MTDSLTGRKQSPEHIAKRSAALKGRKLSDEHKAALREAWKCRAPDSEETKELKRQNLAGYKSLPYFGERISEGQKRSYDDPKRRSDNAELCREIRYQQKWRRSSIEKAITQVLDTLGICHEGQKRIGNYVVDIFIPCAKLFIECDGTYWHNRPGVPESDEKRDAALREMGYTVVRLKEEEIRANPELALMSQMIM